MKTDVNRDNALHKLEKNAGTHCTHKDLSQNIPTIYLYLWTEESRIEMLYSISCKKPNNNCVEGKLRTWSITLQFVPCHSFAFTKCVS